MKEHSKNSGKLVFSNGKVHYGWDSGEWCVAVSDLLLIGEYTTSEGPYFDDYFLVFITGENAPRQVASFYADGRDEMLARLSEALDAKIELGLANSPDFKSRILWPPGLGGQELLRMMPAATAWERFRQNYLGADFELVLTDAAKAVFRRS